MSIRKTRGASSFTTRGACECPCPGCCDQGHHCDNAERGCHFNINKEVSSRPSQRIHPQTAVPSPPTGSTPPHLDGEGCHIAGKIPEYSVRFMLYNPFDETHAGSPVVVRDTKILAPDERVAVEAALVKLNIPWQGSDGTRRACGMGHNPYMIFNPSSLTHVLSWGSDEKEAKAFAYMVDAKHCYPVIVEVVEKISPTEK